MEGLDCGGKFKVSYKLLRKLDKLMGTKNYERFRLSYDTVGSELELGPIQAPNCQVCVLIPPMSLCQA